MYIAVYPILFTIRRSDLTVQQVEAIKFITQVDQQASSGQIAQIAVGQIAQIAHQTDQAAPTRQQRQSSYINLNQYESKLHKNEQWISLFIRIYGRNIIFKDLTWVILSIGLILYIEGRHIVDYSEDLSIFHVIFEVISAYGTVGCSLSSSSLSFSQFLSSASRIVIVLVMILGKHRGLPKANDSFQLFVDSHYYLNDQDDLALLNNDDDTKRRKISIN